MYEEKENEMAADYSCKCKNCRAIDPSDISGYKWYCKLWKMYMDPDVTRECEQYIKA